MATRSEVYSAIDSERAYQESLWNPETTESKGLHELESFFYYIERYLRVANETLSTKATQVAYPEGLEIMRKVAGLAVAAMEQHGAPHRKGF